MSYRPNPWFSPPALGYVPRFLNPHGGLQPDQSLTYCGCCGLPRGVCPCPHGHDPFARAGGPDGTCLGGATYEVRENPWFSPPALNYVSRFMNPPKRNPMPFLEWGTKTRGHGELDYLYGYNGPPGYAPPGQGPLLDVEQNPPFSTGDRVTWSEEALDLEIGRPGQIMRVEGHSLHPSDEGRTRIVTERGHRRQVNDWEIVHAPGARSNAGEARHDVLCQCGWGRTGMLESEIPESCPVCGHRLLQDGHSEDYWEGVQSEQEDWDDPSLGAAYGDDAFYMNPRRNWPWGEGGSPEVVGVAGQWGVQPNAPSYFSRASGTARPYSRGSLHRTMETDPMHESRMKGMLAFYGKKYFGLELTGKQIERMLGKSPKTLRGHATAKHAVKKHVVTVGKRKIQVGPVRKGQKVKLADVKRRVDAVFYAQGRGLRTLPGVSVSADTVPAPAKRRRGKVTKLPKKKAKKRRRAANPPPPAKRCVKKKKSGQRCKGKKHPGEQTCVFHTPRFAPGK